MRLVSDQGMLCNIKWIFFRIFLIFMLFRIDAVNSSSFEIGRWIMFEWYKKNEEARRWNKCYVWQRQITVKYHFPKMINCKYEYSFFPTAEMRFIFNSNEEKRNFTLIITIYSIRNFIFFPSFVHKWKTA